MLFLAGLTGYLHWRAQIYLRRAEAAVDWIERCRGVRLTDTREELLQRMGASAKESVEADGRPVLLYSHTAVSDKFPRFYLDPKRGRVDEIVCTEKQIVRMTPEHWLDWDRHQDYLYAKEKHSESRALRETSNPAP